MSAVVSDSSPLNYLALLSDFHLLREIYGSLVIPPAVYREVVESGGDYPVAAAVRAAVGSWISVAGVPAGDQVTGLQRACRLDRGEAEAIAVAESLGGITLLMDEQRGVRCARSRGLSVVRTPMIYAEAKLAGLIGSVRQKLDELRDQGFRLSDRHYEMILDELGER